jgi:hypothetical protein
VRAVLVVAVLVNLVPVTANAGRRAERLKAAVKAPFRAVRTAGESTTGWRSTLASGVHGVVIAAPKRAIHAIREHPKAALITVGTLTTATVLGTLADWDLRIPLAAANLTAFGLQARYLVPQILRARGRERANLIGQLVFWGGLTGGSLALTLHHDHSAALHDHGPAHGMPGHDLSVMCGTQSHAADTAAVNAAGNVSSALGLAAHAGHFALVYGQVAASVQGKPKPAANHDEH